MKSKLKFKDVYADLVWQMARKVTCDFCDSSLRCPNLEKSLDSGWECWFVPKSPSIRLAVMCPACWKNIKERLERGVQP